MWAGVKDGDTQVKSYGGDVAGLQRAEDLGALAFVMAECAVAEGVLDIRYGAGGAGLHLGFAQGGDEDDVSLLQKMDGFAKVACVLSAEIGEQDDQGAAALEGHDALGGLDEVAGLGGGFVIVEVIQQARHGWQAFDGLQPALDTAEPGDSDLVALAEGDIGDEEHGIEAVVELAEFAIHSAHSAAAVGDEEDALVALLFELAADEHLTTGGGLPIDFREDVAVLVVAELVEIERGSPAAAFDDAHLLFAVGGGEQGVADDGLVVRVAAGLTWRAGAVKPMPEAEAGPDEHMGRGKGVLAAAGEMRLVGEFHGLAGRERQSPGQADGLGLGGQAIVDGDVQWPRQSVAEGEGDEIFHPEGEATRQGAGECKPVRLWQRKPVDECSEEEGSARDDPKHLQLGPNRRGQTEQGPDDDESEGERSGAH